MGFEDWGGKVGLFCRVENGIGKDVSRFEAGMGGGKSKKGEKEEVGGNFLG